MMLIMCCHSQLFKNIKLGKGCGFVNLVVSVTHSTHTSYVMHCKKIPG